MIVAIDHVQLAMPAGGEAQARDFYWGALGLDEAPHRGAEQLVLLAEDVASHVGSPAPG